MFFIKIKMYVLITTNVNSNPTLGSLIFWWISFVSFAHDTTRKSTKKAFFYRWKKCGLTVIINVLSTLPSYTCTCVYHVHKHRIWGPGLSSPELKECITRLVSTKWLFWDHWLEEWITSRLMVTIRESFPKMYIGKLGESIWFVCKTSCAVREAVSGSQDFFCDSGQRRVGLTLPRGLTHLGGKLFFFSIDC